MSPGHGDSKGGQRPHGTGTPPRRSPLGANSWGRGSSHTPLKPSVPPPPPLRPAARRYSLLKTIKTGRSQRKKQAPNRPTTPLPPRVAPLTQGKLKKRSHLGSALFGDTPGRSLRWRGTLRGCRGRGSPGRTSPSSPGPGPGRGGESPPPPAGCSPKIPPRSARSAAAPAAPGPPGGSRRTPAVGHNGDKPFSHCHPWGHLKSVPPPVPFTISL